MTRGTFTVRSFAKINLALTVLGKRPDGFHEIRTVFQSIDLHDELEVSPAAKLQLSVEGEDVIPNEENLVWKAAQLLARETGTGGGASIRLRKRIPIGAGLGGGSSNAAVTLLALSRLWKIDPESARLPALARHLGSDVPYFLSGGTALGIGRGEEIYPLPDLPSRSLVLVYPGVHIPTGQAYRSLKMELTSSINTNRIQRFCSQIEQGETNLARIFNDFETSILPEYPAVSEAKAELLRRGALAAMLSGSGSSVFGFFLDEESALAASRESGRAGWRVFPAKTLSRVEYLQRLFG